MKLIVAFVAVLAVAMAAPQGNKEEVRLIKETPSNNIGVDGYNFNYELSNGATRDESAHIENAGTDDEGLVVSGSYNWIDEATGQRYTITYTADRNGFHPVGDHIPA